MLKNSDQLERVRIPIIVSSADASFELFEFSQPISWRFASKSAAISRECSHYVENPSFLVSRQKSWKSMFPDGESNPGRGGESAES